MDSTSHRLAVGQVLGRAVYLTRRSARSVLGAGAMVGVAWGTLDYFGFNGTGVATGMGVGSLLLAAAITTYVDDRYVAASPERQREMNGSNDHLLTLLGASLMSGAGVLLGLVLLVVPGLVVAAWWGIHMPLIVREETGAVESLAESRRRARGNVLPLALSWQVAGGLALALVVGGMWGAPLDDRLPLGWAIWEAVLLTAAFPVLPVVACAMYDLLLPARDEAPAASGEGLDRQSV